MAHALDVLRQSIAALRIDGDEVCLPDAGVAVHGGGNLSKFRPVAPVALLKMVAQRPRFLEIEGLLGDMNDVEWMQRERAHIALAQG